jgi:hypothetical protein
MLVYMVRDPRIDLKTRRAWSLAARIGGLAGTHDRRDDLETALLTKLRRPDEDTPQARALGLISDEDAGELAWTDPMLDVTPAIAEALAHLSGAPPAR